MTLVQAQPEAPACVISHAGGTLHLLPQRAAWWPEQRALLVADVHLGKATSFAALGVPLGPAALGGTTRTDLVRLAELVRALGAQHLVVLGDLLHAAHGCDHHVLAALTDFGRELRQTAALTLVRGNHDDKAGDPPPEARFVCVDQPWALGALMCRHHPPLQPPVQPPAQPRAQPPLHPPAQRESLSEAASCAQHISTLSAIASEVHPPLTLCGHIHPAVSLRDMTRRRERAPCFWLSSGVLVLPAFGSFTGGKAINPRPGDAVFAVGPDAVLRVR